VPGTNTPTPNATSTRIPTNPPAATNTPAPTATDTALAIFHADTATPTALAPGYPPESSAIDTAAATIGARGGSLSVASGETVTFGPGTFGADTLVTLRVYNSSDIPAPPDGGTFIGHAIDVKPEGVTFDPPALITFPYDDSADIDPTTLAIWVYINGGWQLLGGAVDPVAHTVSVRVPHFTLYALISGGAPGGLPDTGRAAAAANAGHDVFGLLAAIAGMAGMITLAGWSMRRRSR
jgi:hypothetical protein